ncbi:hypothetical protein D3C86_1435970 [compost metagenome]
MDAKAQAKTSPLSPNASGSDVDMIRPAAISPNSINRTGPRSGSSQLVIQLVSIHTHHTAASRIAASSAPSGVRRPSSKWLTWVMAKTKTRSKNSSTKPTLACSPGPRARIRLAFMVPSKVSLASSLRPAIRRVQPISG